MMDYLLDSHLILTLDVLKIVDDLMWLLNDCNFIVWKWFSVIIMISAFYIQPWPATCVCVFCVRAGGDTGCFGKKKKSSGTIGKESSSKSKSRSSTLSGRHSGHSMSSLWQPDIVRVYLPLLRDCSNPDTLEAAAGAIQNLTAGDWQVTRVTMYTPGDWQVNANSTWLVTSRHDTFDVSSPCILAVSSLSNSTAWHDELDWLDTSNVSETWRDEPSGIWV